MSNYENFQPSILPAYLARVNGRAYAATLGMLKDQLSDYARAAAVIGMPNALQPEALPAIGYERQMPRGLSETDAQYAERLRQAWDAWHLAGTPLGILLQLEVLYPGIPIVLVQQALLAFTLAPATVPPGSVYDRLIVYELPAGGWTFDGNSGLPFVNGFWSRFGILFPGPLPPSWTDIVSPPTSLTAPSLNEVNDIIAIVNKWRAAKATFMGINVLVSGLMWDWPPSQKWDDPGLVWGGVVAKFGPAPY